MNIKQGNVAVSFNLQSELGFLVDTFQVVKELTQFASIMEPADERIITLTKSAEVFVVCFLQSRLFKVLREEFGDDREQ
jgi:hypothetical protein